MSAAEVLSLSIWVFVFERGVFPIGNGELISCDDSYNKIRRLD